MIKILLYLLLIRMKKSNNYKKSKDIIYLIPFLFINLFIILIMNFKKDKPKNSIKNYIKNNIKNKKYIGGKNSEYFSNKKNLLNIYDEPLNRCGTDDMDIGSWDAEGKCSELGGGVHQICVKNISNNTKNFSKKTGQSDWSSQRNNDNHCVCLGAWSLYNNKDNTVFKNKRGSKKILKCNAIPKVALSKNYISKFSQGWNKWNGLEVPSQIKDGVEALVHDCYDETEPKSKKLKNNYCNFAKNINSLNKTNLYKELCK